MMLLGHRIVLLGAVSLFGMGLGCPARPGGGQRACVNDADCTNGQYCDGAERCTSGQCAAGANPCAANESCIEATDSCRRGCTTDAECADSTFCNGAESCHTDGTCGAGTNPCGASELCDETNDACVPEGTNVPPFAPEQSAHAVGDMLTHLTMTATDPNGDDLTFTIISEPEHGTLSGLDNTPTGDATIDYLPEPGYVGDDGFTFAVTDGTATTPPVDYRVTVDPPLRRYMAVFSTYLGGRGEDTIRDVAVDREGSIYVVGGTNSSDFPVTAGVYQPVFATGGTSVGTAGDHDAFVTKLGPNGGIIWSTFLGGPNYDRAYAVEVDDDGNVYVGGRAGDGFPATAGAVQPSFGGDVNPARLYGEQDGFVAKLSPDGTQLLWATYFGGDDFSFFRDIDVDASGRVHGVLTRVAHTNPHITPGAFQTALQGGDDGVMVRFSADGSRVEWATYFGGSADDLRTPSIRVHSTGEVYVWGFTDSTDLPTSTDSFDRSYNGGTDEYIAKLSADGRTLVFGAYVGGSDLEFTETHGLMLDAAGNAYVTATTKSTDFPVTPGAFQVTYGGSAGPNTGQGTNYPGDAFVAVISVDGRTMLAATYVGGSAGEGPEGIGVDAEGNVYISGATYSADFPTTSDAFQRTIGGAADFFAVKLNSSLTTTLYSTFVGGTGIDYGRSSITDPAGAYYVVGHCQSNDWPTVNAPQPNRRGGTEEGAIIKFSR